jgi:hypothetical protein
MTKLAQQLTLFLVPGASRAARDRAVLERRRDRLEGMDGSIRQATARLETLAMGSHQSVIRIRPEFVYRSSPAPVVASDRKAPPREHRPPATRLISSRGAALRIILIALFEAQIRTRLGTYPDNERPLFTERDTVGWIDLLATDASPSGSGRSYMGTGAKKGRQFCRTLDRLVSEQLVALPATSGNIHEGFRLLNEGGRHYIDRNGGYRARLSHVVDNERYRVPRRTDPTFLVPMQLFTNGWIHVLEDSELALLLILAFLQAKNPGEAFVISSAERILHLGLGRDAYEAHRMLQRLGLATVTQNDIDSADPLNKEFGNGNLAAPLAFRYQAGGMNQNGLEKMRQCLDSALAPSQSFQKISYHSFSA